MDTSELRISIEVCRTLRHTVEVIKVSPYTSGTVGGDNRTSCTSRRTPVASDPVRHQVSPFNTAGHTGSFIIKRQSSRALFNTEIVRKQVSIIATKAKSRIRTVITPVNTQLASTSSI